MSSNTRLYTQDNLDDTASVITDLTDAQIESVDVNLDLIENWNEPELREAQVCVCVRVCAHECVYLYACPPTCMPPHLHTPHLYMMSLSLSCLVDRQTSDAVRQPFDPRRDQTTVQRFVIGIARRRAG